jgi:predicted HAD superfamily Cof-like phosphohydrolase
MVPAPPLLTLARAGRFRLAVDTTVNREQAMVADFHRAFSRTPPDGPDLPAFPGRLRISLIQEEADEFAQAVRDGDLVEMVDALCDLLYVTYGAAVDLGVDLEPFFAEVHRSNMAKVGGTRRADGKWLKPEGWTPPDIAGLLRRRYGDGVLTPQGGEASAGVP